MPLEHFYQLMYLPVPIIITTIFPSAHTISFIRHFAIFPLGAYRNLLARASFPSVPNTLIGLFWSFFRVFLILNFIHPPPFFFISSSSTMSSLNLDEVIAVSH